MHSCDLTEEAENDIRQIARYSLATWGRKHARRYQGELTRTFERIARDEVPLRAFSETLPDIFIARCRHHYIFYLRSRSRRPLVIAVFHERQDIVSRLAERLDDPENNVPPR